MLNAFQTELAAIRRFIDLLQREQSALVNADVNQLISLSSEKGEQADQLAKLSLQRVNMLRNLGVATEKLQIEQWLRTQPREVAEAWKTLVDAAKVAQELNQVNGKLIETRMQNNQQALNVLMGAANKSSVYGADGQPRALQPSSQRILGKV